MTDKGQNQKRKDRVTLGDVLHWLMAFSVVALVAMDRLDRPRRALGTLQAAACIRPSGDADGPTPEGIVDGD